MSAPSQTLKERGTAGGRRVVGLLLATVYCLLTGCASPSQQNKNDEGTPVIKYDEHGQIKGLFGLRTKPSGDPTCRPKEYTVDFVNIERNEYLVFQLPSTFRVWVKVEGEMQQIFSDPDNIKAREFLAKGKKYKLKAYACDAIGHTAYETVSVELLS